MIEFNERDKKKGSSQRVIDVSKNKLPIGQISKYPGDCGWLCARLSGEMTRIGSLDGAKKWFGGI